MRWATMRVRRSTSNAAENGNAVVAVAVAAWRALLLRARSLAETY